MPSKLKKAIGAVKDQISISLAKVASNTSSTLEVAVLKATTHDDVPVDERYIHEDWENSNYSRSSSDSSRSRRCRSRTNEAIREMKPPMLLDKISYWQRLLEREIATRPTGAAKTNFLVQAALYAMVQESLDLYKDISDGLAVVLDSFFHLPYQTCVTAFQTCVKAAKQFEEINTFYSFCKSVGVGRTSEYPSVQTITEELIESLQEFLKDQSSFPVKSSSELVLQGPGSMKSSRSRFDSYGGQSEFSYATTEPYSERSETNSVMDSLCSSLEDLIRATVTGRSPSISIDLEAYSDIQFKKQFNEDVCDTGSARSLPVSMIDLVSLSEDNGNDDNEEVQDQKQQQPVAEKVKELNKQEAKQEQIMEEKQKQKDGKMY
ncbi:hypothetical protein RND71_013160 [Anisodus tanguticus]|uniref:AP180 N-terminal homology (ANTH) domain-containing protein n=1 Tax=Anisodus tanguticus TaxID=243964 RepID=A0AAE1VGR1_9SOLA|nr:hypothetical protein RND71_013160 [Anisodus tanguticus]